MQLKKRSPEPFFYPGGRVGILLIHGFTGTPSELRPLGDYLHEQGYTVFAPLLSGHGTTPEDMEKTSWRDWIADAHQSYEKLEREVDSVIVAGLSMGGLLAFELAMNYPIQGIISLCTPIWVRDWRASFAPFFRLFKPFHLRKSKKEAHIEEYIVPYEKTPLRSIGNLNRLIRRVKKVLPKITVPTLIIQAEKDETIIPKSANYIYRHLGSERKIRQFYSKSTHIITLDRERREVFNGIHQFMMEITDQDHDKSE